MVIIESMVNPQDAEAVIRKMGEARDQS